MSRTWEKAKQGASFLGQVGAVVGAVGGGIVGTNIVSAVAEGAAASAAPGIITTGFVAAGAGAAATVGMGALIAGALLGAAIGAAVIGIKWAVIGGLAGGFYGAVSQEKTHEHHRASDRQIARSNAMAQEPAVQPEQAQGVPSRNFQTIVDNSRAQLAEARR